MVLERFGRNEHESPLRQLFHIKQTTSVVDYVDRFTQLVDQLVAYDTPGDSLFFTTRFIDGLRDDVRAVVAVQRPSNLDTACSLALLQDEVADSTRRRDFCKPDFSSLPKQYPKGPLPLPVPPDKPAAAPDDSCAVSSGKSVEEKMASLRAYRRARGLCERCAEKWVRGHRCSTSIQLHAMQEVWDLFDRPDVGFPNDASVDTPSDSHLLLIISKDAVSGSARPKTMQFTGVIQGITVLILVDSGSTNSFLSDRVVQQLSDISLVPVDLSVKMANGGLMQCTSVMPACSWEMQGHKFAHDLRVLHLHSYDLIIGMDWLELYSPMKIHWGHKWMAIPYQGHTILLQGINADNPDELVIQLLSVQLQGSSLEPKSQLPAEIADLLVEFQVVFSVPTELPPIRDCDHSIPLIEGARPVNVRPYRYPPHLKDEIERQVTEMLKQGIIQPSASPFSSPVLLVKKKDGSWRFCVDYRYLNALTIRGQFPIPVFDQLMDELCGASWFSILDLYSGYHQIRLKAGEEFKTAFQTHYGHFEFRVMAFGLSEAPGSFQGAMNSTLQPLLRKCVIFFDDILVYSRTYSQHIDHLRLVLSLLAKDKWFVKLSKCNFAQRQIAYLGHTISELGVSTDPAKVEAILKWPVPTNVKELRSFLGLAGYYRKFVRHFAVICEPLTDLLKKNSFFVWTQDHQTAFATLQQVLCSAPVLALPNFSKVFCIETDACLNGVGAVLLQENHPLAFVSRPLGVKSQGLSTYEKEYLAILMAVEQWRPYLLHQEFIIYTDQKSLIRLNEQRLNTP